MDSRETGELILEIQKYSGVLPSAINIQQCMLRLRYSTASGQSARQHLFLAPSSSAAPARPRGEGDRSSTSSGIGRHRPTRGPPRTWPKQFGGRSKQTNKITNQLKKKKKEKKKKKKKNEEEKKTKKKGDKKSFKEK